MLPLGRCALVGVYPPGTELKLKLDSIFFGDRDPTTPQGKEVPELGVFLEFKANTDSIADGLNMALASVLEGVGGMDKSFVEGETQMADETRTLMGSVSFDAARFSGGGSASV